MAGVRNVHNNPYTCRIYYVRIPKPEIKRICYSLIGGRIRYSVCIQKT